jgi:hypothetical protein
VIGIFVLAPFWVTDCKLPIPEVREAKEEETLGYPLIERSPLALILALAVIFLATKSVVREGVKPPPPPPTTLKAQEAVPNKEPVIPLLALIIEAVTLLVAYIEPVSFNSPNWDEKLSLGFLYKVETAEVPPSHIKG